MRIVRPPKLQTYAFLFSMPLISIVLNLILYKQNFWIDYRIWYLSFPLILVMGFVSWYIHVQYDHFIENKYPELNQSKQRIMGKVSIIFLVMIPSVIAIFYCYDYFQILGYSLVKWDLVKGLAVGISVNLVFQTLYEADYALMKYKESLAEKETLEQVSLQDEFDTLKNQVNPHFLFNCFNTLSSLISIDKAKAEQFLNELSKVYRYLLRNNQDGIGTVESEVNFIKSYFQLLQTRHGDAVKLNIEIDRRYHNYILPSLTLQLLVENVVKHNVVSKSKPLVIDIFTTAGNKLVVNNNLQRRTMKVPSNRVGLDNIRAKYELLKQDGFQIIEDDKNFTVVLPLIWKPS